jgi:hypothetical protein
MSFNQTNPSPQAVETALQRMLFGKAKLGTYTGDVAATKAIIGLGFRPKAVIVYEQVTNKAVIIKSNLDTTKALVLAHAGESVGHLYVDDIIITLDADGFTVGDGTGTANYANEAQAYIYLAFG